MNENDLAWVFVISCFMFAFTLGFFTSFFRFVPFYLVLIIYILLLLGTIGLFAGIIKDIIREKEIKRGLKNES